MTENGQLVSTGQVRVAHFGSMPRVVDMSAGMQLSTLFSQAGLAVAPGDLVRVNGRDANLDQVVQPGDSILVMNKIAGG